MLTDVHEGKINVPLELSAGDNIVVPGNSDRWVYIHEIIGSLDTAGTLEIRSGSTVLATFDLAANQGITEDDVSGDEGVPRFKITAGQNFIINPSANFTGALQYSFRY